MPRAGRPLCRGPVAQHDELLSAHPLRTAGVVGRALLLMLLTAGTTARAATVPEAELAPLLGAGLPGLALTVIDRRQPEQRGDPDAWMAWESRRLELLGETGQWRTLADRVAIHPAGLPPAFTDRRAALEVEALLKLGEGVTAVDRLGRLLWSRGAAVPPALVTRWRHQLVRGYLAAGLHQDALAALIRYRQDYGPADATVPDLPARVLLLAGRPRDALAALDGLDNGTVGALRLLAALDAGEQPPEATFATARDRAEQARRESRPLDAARLWAVAAAAAARGGLPVARIEALEQAVASARLPADETLFQVSAELLWNGYLELGKALGNRAQLLVGEETAWLVLAAERGKTAAVEGRSLYALLASTSPDPIHRQRAHVGLAELLATLPDGPRLLYRLYDGTAAERLEMLPDELLYRLAEAAFAEHDLALAARLFTRLDRPPLDRDPFEWRLRRARTLVLAGDPGLAIDTLAVLLEAPPTEALEERIDRLAQVAFDLQRAGDPRSAIELLRRLLGWADHPRKQRELQLRIAAAYRDGNRPAEAAANYLLAAGNDADGLPGSWRDEARLQAARSLVDAGLLDDARSLYRELVATTKDPGRLALLLLESQRLELPH